MHFVFNERTFNFTTFQQASTLLLNVHMSGVKLNILV